MYFPLNKNKISFNNSENGFLVSYKEETEIPILPHPGAFSKKRRYHQHEGIDLYCEHGDSVINIEDGIILDIFPFTGKQIGTDWWNDTWAILIESNSGVFNYGELIPNSYLKIGDKIEAGIEIGKITTVLKKNKGRPMNMLHLEMYKKGTKQAIMSWDLTKEKPSHLIDPTEFLINLAKKKKLLKE